MKLEVARGRPEEIFTFFEEVCVFGPEYKIERKVLWSVYLRWLQSHSATERIPKKKAFFDVVSRHFGEPVKTGGLYHFKGLRLTKQEAQTEKIRQAEKARQIEKARQTEIFLQTALAFLDEMCVFDFTCKIESDVLWGAYSKWLLKHHPEMEHRKKNFFDVVSLYFGDPARTEEFYYFQGLRLLFPKEKSQPARSFFPKRKTLLH